MQEEISKAKWSPSRRTLVRGAAWTAPAIVIATQAPAYAATRPPVAPPPDSFGCKYPGESDPWYKSYRVEICFLNGTSDPVDVSITGITWRGAAPTYPPTGSTTDLIFDPRFCQSDGPDAGTVADNCTASGSPFPFNFSIAAASGGVAGKTCFWVFWRGDASAQDDMCFTYTYDNGFATTNASACTAIHFDPDCNCTTPQPPYTKDKSGC
jgi:hypothetical protein